MNYTTSTFENKVIQDVLLTDISNININPRKNGLIEENVESLKEAEVFPEIHLGLLDGQLIVVDGYHRLEASKRLGLETIKAYITDYKTIETIIRDAINENINHGQRLSDYDVAMSMYELYNKLVDAGKLTTIKMKDFITSFKIDERRGRSLFNWVVLHKEILDDEITTVKNISFSDEYYSMILFLNEIPGKISNEAKYKIKTFYNKYNHLSKIELRKAIALFKQGLDYEIEAEKLKQAAKEIDTNPIKQETKVKTKEPEKDDLPVDESENTEREVTLKNDLLTKQEPKEEKKDLKIEETKTVEEKIETVEKLNEEITKELSNSKEKFKLDTYLDAMSKQVMTMLMLQSKGNLEDFTKEHINKLNDIVDRLNELTEGYYANDK
jgi:ParB-like nuclease domain.|nr:MAG TPA: chromosome partitioning protein [Caudoviricetes sp.]